MLKVDRNLIDYPELSYSDLQLDLTGICFKGASAILYQAINNSNAGSYLELWFKRIMLTT
jgi:hypothetical protein